MPSRKWLFSLAILPALGCHTIPPEEFDALHKIQVALGQAQKDYILQPGDTLQASVYRGAQIANEYKQEVTVQPDGRVQLLSLSNPIDATGLTVEKLQAKVQDAYAQFFTDARDLRVTLQFLTSTKTQWLPDQVFVGGQVKVPKAIPYRKGLTALRAVADAGSWLYAANESKTVVLRLGPDGKSVAREVDLAAVVLHEAEDVEVFPGDVVYVPLSFIAWLDLMIEFYIRALIPINPSLIRTFYTGV